MALCWGQVVLRKRQCPLKRPEMPLAALCSNGPVRAVAPGGAVPDRLSRGFLAAGEALVLAPPKAGFYNGYRRKPWWKGLALAFTVLASFTAFAAISRSLIGLG